MTKITFPVVRDATQWVVGAWIGVNETIVRQAPPRWEVLVFAGVLMGVPALIGLVSLRPTGEESRSVAPTTESRSSSP